MLALCFLLDMLLRLLWLLAGARKGSSGTLLSSKAPLSAASVSSEGVKRRLGVPDADSRATLRRLDSIGFIKATTANAPPASPVSDDTHLTSVSTLTERHLTDVDLLTIADWFPIPTAVALERKKGASALTGMLLSTMAVVLMMPFSSLLA